MRVSLNNSSQIGIKENGRDRLLSAYIDLVNVDCIRVGKDDLKIVNRMEVGENKTSRLHLVLRDYQNQSFTATITPVSDGKRMFLVFGNKLVSNPSLALMVLEPEIHLLKDSDKERLRNGLERKLSASEQEEKDINELYALWLDNQVKVQRRALSKIETKQEWFDTVYQNVLSEVEVEEVQVKEEVVNA